MNAVERSYMRPKTWYTRQPYGPITMQRTEDQTTATGPDGRTVVVHAAAWKDPVATRKALEGGVTVTLDGQHVATVRRTGTRMAGIRPQLALEATGQLAIPVGAVIERFGISGASRLVAGQRPLIRPPFPTYFTHSHKLTIDPTLDPALVLVYAAATFGLNESLRS